jgi:GDP-4-dehydro-6-deoxy-D-mannose reductase
MRDLAKMRVLVTGAGGFVGQAVMQALQEAGATPIGLTRRPGQGQVHADLATDPLEPILAQMGADAIIHCAGRTHAPDTDAGRALLIADNLTATSRLCAAVARMAARPRLVVVSTAAIWAPMHPGQTQIIESHPIAPVSAYGVSKAAATRAALEVAGLDLAVAVPFNVIGPGQAAHLVPQVFLDGLRADPARLWVTDPSAVRDWVDVRDVAAALIALAQPGGPTGLFNVATGQGRSLAEVLAAVCHLGGWPLPAPDHPPAPAGVARSVGSAQRLTDATGWRPVIPFDQSLRDMIGASGKGLAVL